MANTLENVKKTFMRPPRDFYYEGRDSKEFDGFLRLLGYVVPDRVTPEELILFMTFLVKDIKEEVCRFQNSEEFMRYFEMYLNISGNIDLWITYLPNFIQHISTPEFNEEFSKLFRKEFYHTKEAEEEKQDYGYIEVSPDVIDISNKDKAEVLAALYNHSQPVGMGIVQYDPAPMSVETARKVLAKMGYTFGYLKGRVMHLSLEGDTVSVYAYNRDNDHPGLGQKAISTCRNIDKGSYQKTKGSIILPY